MTQPRFNGVELTPETIRNTRVHFARIQIACAKDYYGPGKRGEQLGHPPEDLARFRRRSWDNLKAGLRGDFDHTFTFLQRAHWLQTGEPMKPLLP